MLARALDIWERSAEYERTSVCVECALYVSTLCLPYVSTRHRDLGEVCFMLARVLGIWERSALC